MAVGWATRRTGRLDGASICLYLFFVMGRLATWRLLMVIIAALLAVVAGDARPEDAAAAVVASHRLDGLTEGEQEAPANSAPDSTGSGAVGSETEPEEEPEEPEDARCVPDVEPPSRGSSRSVLYGEAAMLGEASGVFASIYRPPWRLPA